MEELRLKFRSLSFVLVALLFSSIFLSVSTFGDREIYRYRLIMTTKVNLEYDETGSALITIAGRVMDELNKSVSKATVSIQVADPIGSTSHIALVYSKSDGVYLNEFLLKGEYLPGNYTIYMTASKVGYLDANLELPFSILILDFSISIIPDNQVVKQGEKAIYEIFLVRTMGTNFPVSLTVHGSPNSTSVYFKDDLTTEPNSTLYIETFEDTPIGTYNLTVASEGGGKNHSTSFFFQVIEGEEPDRGIFRFYWILLIVIFSIVGVFLLLIYFRKIDRSSLKKIERIIDPIRDREYLGTARALAKLEELKASNNIDEETYLKLKKEYEDKLKD